MKHAKEVMTDVANKYVQEQSASKNTEKELPELKFLYEGYEVQWLSLVSITKHDRLYKGCDCKIQSINFRFTAKNNEILIILLEN